jgi:hypothetical protein
MRSFATTLLALTLLAAAPPTARGQLGPEPAGGDRPGAALAEPAAPAPAAGPAAPHVLGVGAKAGVALPQLDSALDTTFAVHVELSYRLPFWGSRLGLYTALGYSMPTASGSGSDDRLPDGRYTFELTQHQTKWDIGIGVRVMPWDSVWNVGFLVGPRLTFVSTITNGEAGGESFGEHDEQGTLYGAFAAALGEFRLGPGALFGELSYGLAREDLRTTGDLALHELSLLVGYRFEFVF